MRIAFLFWIFLYDCTGMPFKLIFINLMPVQILRESRKSCYISFIRAAFKIIMVAMTL